MTHKAKPRPLAGGAGEGTVGKLIEPNYRSETPTRKVKYFGRHDNAARAAIRMVCAAFGEPDCKQLRLFTCPDRPSDPPKLVGDNRLLRSTGWKPEVSLEDGLRQTLEWWQGQFSANASCMRQE